MAKVLFLTQLSSVVIEANKVCKCAHPNRTLYGPMWVRLNKINILKLVQMLIKSSLERIGFTYGNIES